MLSDVSGVRRELSKCIEFVPIESKVDLVSDFDSDTALIVLAIGMGNSKMIDPLAIIEGFEDRTIAVDDPRRTNSGGLFVPPIDRGRCFPRLAIDRCG